MLFKFACITLLILLLVLFFNILVTAGNNGDYVVLVHGLGRTKLSMLGIEIFLKNKGYQVINIEYPSSEYQIQELADHYLKRALDKCTDRNKKINFVTHSLGGIIVRYYLSSHQLNNIGRVVMLSPPNHGSKLADIADKTFVFRWLKGPVLEQLTTDKNSLTNRLGPVNFELGIITGNRSYNFINSLIIPGEDDGKVSLDRARVENMKDFLVVPRTHTFIMFSKRVFHQIYYFLENGVFNQEEQNTLLNNYNHLNITFNINSLLDQN